MHAEGYHMGIRRGHQKRSFRLQRAFRQRSGHLFHETDGYGKAEYVSGFARYPRAGTVRIVWNSHGLRTCSVSITAGTVSARHTRA